MTRLTRGQDDRLVGTRDYETLVEEDEGERLADELIRAMD